MDIRHDWTKEELQDLYVMPLMALISQAHDIHLQHHPLGEIQVCNLISVKTGGCPEDCKYCAQSAHYQTPVRATPLMSRDSVVAEAKQAIDRGATRVCLGAAWREVRDNKPFEEILGMIRELADLGVEVCCTLGRLQESQARRLKEAGLYAYNHNLDTSERFYPSIITTRTYQERLATLDLVESMHLSVCCGAIFGLGEEPQDRLDWLLTLAKRNPHPESVPLNRLSAIPGTPLEKQKILSIWEFIRQVAIVRMVLPASMIRLSAGREKMTAAEQALCFFAGANSLFMGEKLLTVSNAPIDQDEELFQLLGLRKQPAFAKRRGGCGVAW